MCKWRNAKNERERYKRGVYCINNMYWECEMEKDMAIHYTNPGEFIFITSSYTIRSKYTLSDPPSSPVSTLPPLTAPPPIIVVFILHPPFVIPPYYSL